MTLLPSKGKLALIGAAGLMAVLYAKRQKRSDADALAASDNSLASLVPQPGPVDGASGLGDTRATAPNQPRTPAWQTSATAQPTAEDPYPEDRPTVLPTGPAPGG